MSEHDEYEHYHEEHKPHDQSDNHPYIENAVYTCPMHPEVLREGEGRCPKCGMALVQAAVSQHGNLHKDHADQGKHAGHSLSMFIQKFWVCFVLTIPVILYSDLPQEFFGFTPPSFPGSNFLPAILSTIIFFYGGWIFITGAVREICGRAPGMMTLIALAITVAYFYSIYVTIIGVGMTLFWELATLIDVMLLGHWLEMRAVQGAQGALAELAKLLPDTAEVIRNGQPVKIPIAELKAGDIVLVRPGSNVPADGVVVEGESDVNEAFVTGESKPVMKVKDAKVIGGTINGAGSLKVGIEKIGDETFLAGVLRLVEEAQVSRSRIQVLSDRAAFWLTMIAIATGTLTLIYWLTVGTPSEALERTVAVLVVACPHALGLAIPLVASISTSLAALNGVLVRERLALEQARNINIVTFDKTGTLTTGEFSVNEVISATSLHENELLALAASANLHSEHFLAKAMVKRAQELQLGLHEPTEFTSITGQGIRANVGGNEVVLGGNNLMAARGIGVPETIQDRVSAAAQKGYSVIFIIRNDEVIGAMALGDTIRPESKEAIKELKAMGIDIAMITGDSKDVAASVATELGIETYFAEVLPEDKVAVVKQLQGTNNPHPNPLPGKQGEGAPSPFQGEKSTTGYPLLFKEGQGVVTENAVPHRVAMVGDGINDAPALVQADVGIAIGAGTNVAIESAGIILVRSNPLDIVKIFKLSRGTYRKMLQNLFWATGYNVVAIPLAAGVLASRGFVMNPALAALFMSLSTIIVAFNAVLLRRIKL